MLRFATLNMIRLLLCVRLGSEIESELWDDVNSDRQCIVTFNAGKTYLVSYYRWNNFMATDIKIDASVLDEKSLFKMLGLTFCSKLNLSSHIVLITSTASMMIGASTHSTKFLSSEIVVFSINLPFDPVWNTVNMSMLVLLITTLICWVSSRKRFGVFRFCVCCFSWNLDSLSKYGLS